jgi:adenosylcobinamide-GDP ribazoletransferase
MPPRRYARAEMAFVEELSAAVGSLTVFRRAASGARRESQAAALAFYPIVGLVLGTLATAAAWLLSSGAVGVLVLLALGGARAPLALAAAADAALRAGSRSETLARLRAAPGVAGGVVAAGAVAVRLWAAASLPAPARSVGLALAPMLGAWALVVQCYGGAPTHAQGAAKALIGRARFREFGWASLVGFGVTLGIGEAIGLLVLLVAALVTLGVRVLAHRRVGGLTGRLLAATRELVETAVLATLAVLWWLRP